MCGLYHNFIIYRSLMKSLVNETSYCLGNINIRFSETERKYDG